MPKTGNSLASYKKHTWILFPLLSLFLVSAHFLRIGQAGLTVSFLGLGLLFLTRAGWARIVLAVVLFFATLLWAKTSVTLILFRIQADMEWARLAVIMGLVYGLTLLSALLLISGNGRSFFPKEPQAALPKALIFFVIVGVLVLIREQVPFPVLLLERYIPQFTWVQIALMGVYGAWIGGKMLEPAAARKIRPRIWGLFSFVFFSQLVLGLLGMEQMLMTGKLHLPVPALIIAGPLFRGSGFFMLFLFLSTVILVGSAWCSHLCYIGAWDDGCSRLSRRKSTPLPGWANTTRALLLLFTIGVALGLRILDASWTLALTAAALFGLIGVMIMVFLSRKTGTMIHCTAYCPLGLAGNILGRISPWRIKIHNDCTQCGMCTKICRYDALNDNHIQRRKPGLKCTLCGDCTSICHSKAITYSFPGLSPSVSRTAFTGMVVILHTVFLAVARM